MYIVLQEDKLCNLSLSGKQKSQTKWLLSPSFFLMTHPVLIWCLSNQQLSCVSRSRLLGKEHSVRMSPRAPVFTDPVCGDLCVSAGFTSYWNLLADGLKSWFVLEQKVALSGQYWWELGRWLPVVTLWTSGGGHKTINVCRGWYRPS